MNKTRTTATVAALSLLFLTFSGCVYVRIAEHASPSEVERRFQEARSDIDRLHDTYPHREGRARRVCVLVFEQDSEELVEVHAPLWIVNACLSLGMKAAESGNEFDFEERYGLAWRSIRDLGQFGPGLLVEVEGDEEMVLVWLK